MTNRKGIMAGGNWIVDHIKIIDKYPRENMLVIIEEEIDSVGGGPNNVLVDLAKMECNIPLFAMGKIGEDSDAKFIQNELLKYNINTENLTTTNEAKTSYTDVMSVSSTGNRTFFHSHGTNRLLGVDDFNFSNEARIFHLAYLLLLKKLDAPDKQYGARAARILKQLQGKGYKTSVDVVSSEEGNFKKVVIPCLKYIDYFIVNEIEAGQVVGIEIRNSNQEINTQNLENAADVLLQKGVNELVVIHFSEGGFVKDIHGKKEFVASFKVDAEEIKGATGAGDAFCAGCLYAIHEGLPYKKMLQIAHASAKFNLSDPTSVGGVVSLSKILEYISSAEIN